MWIEESANKRPHSIQKNHFTKWSLYETLLWNNDFQLQIEGLQRQVDNYIRMEQQAEEKRKLLFQDYKDKKISSEEYTQKAKSLLPWDIYENPKYDLEKQIRQLQVKQDILGVSQEKILTNRDQLGKNISDGWTNNKGVYIISDMFVARRAARWYDDASRLILYKDKIISPIIKKTLQIVELNGDVYQVQERAFGKSILQLTKEELDSIPAQHYKDFWHAKHEMDKLWLSIDTSGGKSNVLYDSEKWFSIIDLGIGKSDDDQTVNRILFDNKGDVYYTQW